MLKPNLMGNTSDPKSFVEGLQINYPQSGYGKMRLSFMDDQGSEPLLQNDKDQVFLADKSLISFASQLDVQNRSDVLDSTLIAQLAARKAVPDPADSIGWYNAYVNVLSHIGWSISGGQIQEFQSSGTVLELQNVIIDILKAAFGANYVTIIAKALDAIKSLGDSSGKIEAFEKNTHSASNGSFQIGVATQENNAVNLNLGTFLITSTEKITHILFVKFTNNQTKLQYAYSSVTLDSDIYKGIRDDIRQKLGRESTKFVSEISI